MATEPLEKEVPQEGEIAPVKTHSLLSMEALNSLNARFELTVEEVLSGKDVIGQGQLAVVLEEGTTGRPSTAPDHTGWVGGCGVRVPAIDGRRGVELEHAGRPLRLRHSGASRQTGHRYGWKVYS